MKGTISPEFETTRWLTLKRQEKQPLVVFEAMPKLQGKSFNKKKSKALSSKQDTVLPVFDVRRGNL